MHRRPQRWIKRQKAALPESQSDAYHPSRSPEQSFSIQVVFVIGDQTWTVNLLLRPSWFWVASTIALVSIKYLHPIRIISDQNIELALEARLIVGDQLYSIRGIIVRWTCGFTCRPEMNDWEYEVTTDSQSYNSGQQWPRCLLFSVLLLLGSCETKISFPLVSCPGRLHNEY